MLVEFAALVLEMRLLEEKKTPQEKNPDYFKGLSGSTASKRAAHFKKQSKMSDDNPRAYKPAPGDKRPPTPPKESQWTKKARKMGYSESVDEGDFDESAVTYAAARAALADEPTFKVGGKEFDTEMSKEKAKEILGKDEAVSEALIELAGEVLEEKLSEKTRKALKKKAEKANAPLGALTTVYNKGLAAWKTGHRPGANQHAWAMARVNSFLAGGPARKVDSAQWEKVKKHRKK